VPGIAFDEDIDIAFRWRCVAGEGVTWREFSSVPPYRVT